MPTYRRRDRIEACIDALLADDATTEVVVVIDGTRDGTLELLEARAEHDPRIVPLFVEHGGLQLARQAGAERASGEVLLTIDDDVVASPGLVAGHAGHHAAQTGLVVLGHMPTVRPAPRRPGDFAANLYADDYDWAVAGWERDPGSICRTFWGGNCSIRREDALRVGFLSPAGALPYGEDRDFGLRVLRHGLTVRFDRTLHADHHHRRDLTAFQREAHARATGAHMIHEAHADLIGPLDLARYEGSLPSPARWAIRAARARAIASIERALLVPLVHAAGAIRWWKLESLAAIVLMHVIEVRTILDRDAGAR